MKLNFEITLSEFAEKLDADRNKKYVIWGAGSCATDFIRELNRGNDFVSYYIDKSELKWGGSIDKIIVKPTECLTDDDSVDAVIVASMYYQDIVKELIEMGYSGEVYSAFHMIWEEKFDYQVLERHLTEIKSMLSDDRSKEIVDKIYEHRKSKNHDFSDICEPDQYFVKDIVKFDPHAVFVDAGAYHGETIDEFIGFQNGVFDKVYAFEMDESVCKILRDRKPDERIEILNYGLWDEKITYNYLSDGSGGSTLGEGNQKAECITLDEVIGDRDVTFIKMDIEGAEMKALRGAERCIKRCKPQLAISIYHKPEDIYDITSIIHEWLPDYKLYIRHHSNVFFETILYVVE